MFGVVCKQLHFWRQSINCQLIFASFCVQGKQRLEIKIWDHLSTCFDVMNSMVVSELKNKLLLKITEVISIVSIHMNFNNLIAKALFLKPSIPLDSWWRVSSNFVIKSLFWLTSENLTILDDFAHIRNVELELGSNCESTENAVGLV